jgi:hypothetical protein
MRRPWRNTKKSHISMFNVTPWLVMNFSKSLLSLWELGFAVAEEMVLVHYVVFQWLNIRDNIDEELIVFLQDSFAVGSSLLGTNRLCAVEKFMVSCRRRHL